MWLSPPVKTDEGREFVSSQSPAQHSAVALGVRPFWQNRIEGGLLPPSVPFNGNKLATQISVYHVHIRAGLRYEGLLNVFLASSGGQGWVDRHDNNIVTRSRDEMHIFKCPEAENMKLVPVPWYGSKTEKGARTKFIERSCPYGQSSNVENIMQPWTD